MLDQLKHPMGPRSESRTRSLQLSNPFKNSSNI